MLPPHTCAALLSLTPALLWGGDITLALPRVLFRPTRPPMSMSLVMLAASPAAPVAAPAAAFAAASVYHAAWALVGG